MSSPTIKTEQLRVYDNILQTIGKTPLVRLNRIGKDLPCPLYAKVEFFNPGGSVKDRIGLNMIEEAERDGRLKPGGTVVEATSGNTGVGLAIACAIKGYKAVFVMPDKMSQEKVQLLRAYGAKVLVTPTAVEPDDPRSYYSVADRVVKETPNAILANQYHNPENPRSHYLTTGPEIWEQTQGQVTDVVLGMGTGGTISGIGQYLKEQNPEIKMIGVDPKGSLLKETWQAGEVPDDADVSPYKVEGIGEDFLPSTLDLSVIDDIVRVDDKESFLWTRKIVREEGIFCGGSSGSAVAGAVRYAQDLSDDRLVVVLLPDTGARYLSKIFDDKWMRENGFLEATWDELSLGGVLSEKSLPGLVTASPDERMTEVIADMKRLDISQMPVLDKEGQITGMVTEVNLLEHMVSDSHDHTPDETIASITQPPPPTYPSDTLLSEVIPTLLKEGVILVTEAEGPIGILTKIDILDIVSQEI
ncbi:MAG: cystathionine beta-synthase [Anaerolineales bacterium]